MRVARLLQSESRSAQEIASCLIRLRVHCAHLAVGPGSCVNCCSTPGAIPFSTGTAMPARIIGMIGVTPPQQDATLLVIEGAISPPFVVEFAQAHEASGFD